MKYDELVLFIPIYGGEFTIVVTDDLEKLTSNYEISPGGKIFGHSFFLQYKDRQVFLIVLNPYGTIRISHGVITHEAVHIANMIFQERGIKPDLDNDEPYAYLVESIVTEVYQFLKTLDKIKISLTKGWK